MQLESCKDCQNLEDRRDIDKVALCVMHHGHLVSCLEFKPKNQAVSLKDVHEQFCVNCANYEAVNGVPVVAKTAVPALPVAPSKANM